METTNRTLKFKIKLLIGLRTFHVHFDIQSLSVPPSQIKSRCIYRVV